MHAMLSSCALQACPHRCYPRCVLARQDTPPHASIQTVGGWVSEWVRYTAAPHLQGKLLRASSRMAVICLVV